MQYRLMESYTLPHERLHRELRCGALHHPHTPSDRTPGVAHCSTLFANIQQSDDVNSYTAQWRRPICGAPPVIYAFWCLQHMQCRVARERRNIPHINFRSLGCNQRWRLAINIRLMYTRRRFELWNDVFSFLLYGAATRMLTAFLLQMIFIDISF